MSTFWQMILSDGGEYKVYPTFKKDTFASHIKRVTISDVEVIERDIRSNRTYLKITGVYCMDKPYKQRLHSKYLRDAAGGVPWMSVIDTVAEVEVAYELYLAIQDPRATRSGESYEIKAMNIRLDNLYLRSLNYRFENGNLVGKNEMMSGAKPYQPFSYNMGMNPIEYFQLGFICELV